MIELTRRLMVATNPYWPFSSLNRWSYRLATDRFVALSSRHPQIRGCYLRHSLARGAAMLGEAGDALAERRPEGWLPGSSDIDLTVLTNGRLSSREEFVFLTAFWRTVGRLQRFLPMLKDVTVLPEHQLATWSRFSIVGNEVAGWQPLGGAAPVMSSYLATTLRLEMDSLSHAVSLYRYTLLDRLSLTRPWTGLAVTDLRRLTTKIHRYALGGRPGAGPPLPAAPFEIGACMLAALEDRCRRLLPQVLESFSGRRPANWRLLFEPAMLPPERDPFPIDLPVNIAPLVEAIVTSHGETIVVLRDGLGVSALSRCLSFFLQALAGGGAPPLVVSRSVFEYLVRVAFPYLFVQLGRERRLLAGCDPLEPPFPAHFFFGHTLLSMLSLSPIMVSVRCRAMILSAGNAWFSDRAFQSWLRRSLLVKLFAESGQVPEWFRNPLPEWQRHYPDVGDRMVGLLSPGADPLGGHLNQAWFELAAAITEDIHRSISTCSVDEVLYAA